MNQSASLETLPRVFDSYILVSQLGEGGMGRVYLALSREGGTEQISVIKRFGNPRAQFTPEQIEENKERFRREAEITMALRHPCIARTFKSVHQGSSSYLVQEFIHGLTLAHLLEDMQTQLLPVPLATFIVAQIAGALEYVHEFRGLGLIHRDLTADNVMFSRAGEVKVIDFGIAKATLADDMLTKPHIVVGKPLWTAPEVAEGRKPDRRADLYALGLLFWYLLSGRNPEGDIDIEKHSLPPPSTFNPEVSAHLDGIVGKALSQEPNHRFQTAREFLEAVVPLIPKGYQGTAELSRFVVGFQLSLELDYFDAMIASTRPLLDQISPRPATFSKRKIVIIAILPSVAAIALSVHFLLGRRNHPSVLLTSPLSPPSVSSSVPNTPQAPPSPPAAARSTPPTEEPFPPAAPPSPPSPAIAARPSQRHRPQPHTLVTTPSEPIANSPSADAAEELLAQAMDYFQRADLPRTLARARASANIRPSPDAYILIARALFESDPGAAKAALETALRLSPGNRQATHLLDQLKQRIP